MVRITPALRAPSAYLSPRGAFPPAAHPQTRHGGRTVDFLSRLEEWFSSYVVDSIEAVIFIFRFCYRHRFERIHSPVAF